SEITGNSSGKPPALHTPRLTASATWRRCALQLLSSDHELQMPTTGRPSNIASLNPSALRYARCMNPSRFLGANQLRLRSGGVAEVVMAVNILPCLLDFRHEGPR